MSIEQMKNSLSLQESNMCPFPLWTDAPNHWGLRNSWQTTCWSFMRCKC